MSTAGEVSAEPSPAGADAVRSREADARCYVSTWYLRGGRGVGRLAILILAFVSGGAAAGPIEVYREGARYCPRDRDAHGAVLDEGQTIERARALLPERYCGPTPFVDGCDVLTENAMGSWRVYFHQYRLRDGGRDWGGLTHTYVILDPVGNCYANIPGTEQGAPR